MMNAKITTNGTTDYCPFGKSPAEGKYRKTDV